MISMLEGGAAGIHAAAQYSRAPLTYPLATARSCASRSPQLRPVILRRWAVRGLTLRRMAVQCSLK